jgi:hypothetical protein
MWSTISSNAGVVSSALFIFQITMQVKMYGLRGWFHWGLGTGVPVDSANELAQELEEEFPDNDN